MKIELRNEPVKQVRNNHKVPGVIYGHGIDPTAISMTSKDLHVALHEYGTSMTFEVTLENETHLVYIKDLQTDFLHNYAPLHVDLMKVSTDDTITSAVPLNFLNRDAVARPGEVLSMNLTEVNAEAKVGSGVSAIDVDLLVLKDVDVLYVKDIDVPQGITLLHEDDEIVANFTAVAEFVESTNEDEEQEPIVIGSEEDLEDTE
jgi:large subunit ribosomal protein L25